MGPGASELASLIILTLLVDLASVGAGRRRTTRPGSEVPSRHAAEGGEAQLREHVERAWAEVSGHIDRLVGSGRMLDRDTLLDLARFLESAMPAVGAYERLVARAYEEALAAAGVSPADVVPLAPRRTTRPGSEVPSRHAAEGGEAQLREHVERAWAEVSGHIDRLVGSGRMLDRDTLLDLARFLESAMPAVGAYERLVARTAAAWTLSPPLGVGER